MTDAPDNPAAYHRSGEFYRVRWPHGGWIIWNWLAARWDHKTDSETAMLAARKAKP